MAGGSKKTTLLSECFITRDILVTEAMLINWGETLKLTSSSFPIGLSTSMTGQDTCVNVDPLLAYKRC